MDCLSCVGDETAMDCQNHYERVFDELNDLRMQHELTDVTLCVEDRKFPVHRAVLASNSPYFRAMFTNGMKESQKEEIELKDVDADVFAMVLQFIYNRTETITMDNVFHLLSVADLFTVSDLTDSCVQFLMSSICVENCLTILRFAKTYFKRDLEATAHKFIADSFWKIVRPNNPCQEFEQLTIEEIHELLDDDNLNVINEQEAFEAAVEWIRHNSEERKEHMPSILSRLRLGHLTKEYFEDIVSVHNFCRTDQCAHIFAPMWNLMTKNNILKRANGRVHPFMKPRVPRGVVFAIGGWSGGTPIAKVETYDCNADQWFDFKSLEDANPRAYHGLVAMNGLVYMIGGFNGTEYYNSVRYFDPVTKQWHDASPMYTPRCYVSTGVLNKHIYACGGYDGRWRLNSVEKYNPPTNQWTKCANMNMKRSDAGCDVIKGKLYIAGGFNGDQCLRTAEAYDPTSNQWTYIHAMNAARSGVSVATYEGMLYVVGGFDGETRLATAERYDPSTNRWVSIPDMESKRSNCALIVLGDMLLAIGGFNGSLTISRSECYDEDTNKWYDLSDMTVNRSALKAVVLSDQPNLRDYSYLGIKYDEFGGEDTAMDEDTDNENTDN